MLHCQGVNRLNLFALSRYTYASAINIKLLVWNVTPIAKLNLCLTRQPTHFLTPSQSSMADSNFRDSAQSDCNGDGKSESVAMDYAEIVVIRHGETEWNAEARIQGHVDVELNEVGRQQAVAVAERLSREAKISVIYSSDLKRASETAEIIASSCGRLEVIKDPDLRERHLGDLEGVVFHEAAKICPGAYNVFISPRRDQEIPGGGESRDQLYKRCISSLQRIGEKHKGERVVVVTHGGVIRQFHKRASPRGRSAGKILNTSVNVLQFAGEGEWTIKDWGDVSHLNQTGVLESGFGGDKISG